MRVLSLGVHPITHSALYNREVSKQILGGTIVKEIINNFFALDLLVSQ